MVGTDEGNSVLVLKSCFCFVFCMKERERQLENPGQCKQQQRDQERWQASLHRLQKLHAKYYSNAKS